MIWMPAAWRSLWPFVWFAGGKAPSFSKNHVWRWSFLIAPTPMVCCQVAEEKRSANKVELRRRPFKESDTLQDNAYDVVVSLLFFYFGTSKLWMLHNTLIYNMLWWFWQSDTFLQFLAYASSHAAFVRRSRLATLSIGPLVTLGVAILAIFMAGLSVCHVNLDVTCTLILTPTANRRFVVQQESWQNAHNWLHLEVPTLFWAGNGVRNNMNHTIPYLQWLHSTKTGLE